MDDSQKELRYGFFLPSKVIFFLKIRFWISPEKFTSLYSPGGQMLRDIATKKKHEHTAHPPAAVSRECCAVPSRSLFQDQGTRSFMRLKCWLVMPCSWVPPSACSQLKKDFHLQLRLVMNVNYTCGGAHFALYTNVKSLCCTPQLIEHYMSIVSKFKKRQKIK